MGASENRGQESRYAILSPWRRQWLRPENELSRIVDPEVLERAGENGKKVFGISALAPYLEAKLDFGQSASQAKFRLGNQGQAILHWTVAGVVDWLALDLTTGAIEPNQSQVVTVTVQRDLSPDRY